MILVNGHKSSHIAVNDRGFQYGDGLFETIEVLEGQPVFLDQHLERLIKGCAQLKIPCPDKNQILSEIGIVCSQVKSAVLKIIVTRGTGGRGYRQPEPIEPTHIISLFPYPSYPDAYYKQGITACFCNTRLGLNPALAGIKHNNRLEQIMARAEWDDPDIQEGIMLDANGYVIEGTMTNLFYVKDNVVYTALLHSSGVAGIIRAILIRLIGDNKLTLIEHNFYKENLLEADEVFITNSIIGIWPVKQIGPICFKRRDITKQLQHLLLLAKSNQASYEA